jgi:hypothetical protein
MTLSRLERAGPARPAEACRPDCKQRSGPAVAKTRQTFQFRIGQATKLNEG